MAKVKIYVWHNVSGEIVAIGRAMGAAKCVPLSGDNQSVLETEIEEGHIVGLHETHIVDVRQKALVKQPGRKGSGR
jgi:hypothetical protein